MFAIFMALIVIGYPVAFSFALTAIAFTMLGLWLGDIRVQQLNALPSRWFGYISDQNLLAIPFFVYMGSIFEKSGQAERLLTAVGRLMGPLRGGLALTVVRRRHDARRSHRRRRRHGDHDGTALAAGDGPLRLRPPPRHRGHRRVGHARPADPTEPRADRPRQHDEGRVRRRAVPRGDRPRPDALRAVRPVRRLRRPALPGQGTGVADRGAPGVPRAGRSCGSR